MSFSERIADSGLLSRISDKDCWGFPYLGPPIVSCYPCLGEGSPAKMGYRKKGALILTSLLEDLVDILVPAIVSAIELIQLTGHIALHRETSPS